MPKRRVTRLFGAVPLALAAAVAPALTTGASAATVQTSASAAIAPAGFVWLEVGGPYASQYQCIADKNDRKANGETRVMQCVKGSDGYWYLLMLFPTCNIAATPAKIVAV